MGSKEEEEQILQAVILADSFDTRFRPITLSIPRSLMPVVNVPVIEYTLEFLAGAGVQEIYVFCTSHEQTIREYIENSSWHEGGKGVKVICMVMSTCLNVGDALREVDSRSIIKHDFVLVSGDVVSNVDLASVIQAHKDRRLKDKQAIMTTVLKKVSRRHSERTGCENAIFGMDAQQRLLYYESARKERKLDLNIDLFLDHPSITLMDDLLDCHIDVCAPEVLMLFTDNFDYGNLREDFLRGVLNAEIMGNKVHTHVTSKYAARVDSLANYAAVTSDVIRRWAFPLVPDENNMLDTSYSYHRGNKYTEYGVKLSRSCKINEDTVIGRGTTIGDRTVVSSCVLGRNCFVGKDCTVESSYIWDKAVVEDGAKVYQSVLCHDTVVRAGAVVGPGCVLAEGTQVGPGTVLKPGTKLTVENMDNLSDDSDWGDPETEDREAKAEGESIAWDETVVGPGGIGHVWEDASDDDLSSLVPRPPTHHEESESKSISEASDIESEEFDADERFRLEVQDTIQRAHQEGHSLENLVLEINGVKFAYDKTFGDCGAAILPAIVELIDSSKFLASAKALLTQYKGLFQRFLPGEEDQQDVILCLQEFCVEQETYASKFAVLLQLLYEGDIIGEDSILSWATEQEGSVGREKALMTQAEKFLNWLREESGEGDYDYSDD